MGFGKGSYLQAPVEEDEENVLSPENCYECKINGYPKRGRQRRNADDNSPNEIQNVSLASVDIDAPINLTLNISDLANKQHILEFIPALESLENRVRYIISHGNEGGIFRIHQKDGISYLHLGHKKVAMGIYNLEIASIPLYRKKELQKLEDEKDHNYLSGEVGQTLKMKLHIHLY